MQVVGEPAGAVGDVGPREAPVAKHETLLVGASGRDGLVNVPNGQRHPATLRRNRAL